MAHHRREIFVAVHPAERRIADDADAAGVGNENGASRKPDSWTQCVPVMSPLPLSSEQPANTGSNFRPRGRMAVTPGADRALAFNEWAFARDQRREADLYSGDIGNGIERTRRPALKRNAQIARALHVPARG